MKTKCLFPVAGYGTRFLPATKAMPKELLPIVDKPLIQYAAEEAIAAGIERLRKDPELANRLSRNGFKRFQNGFTKSVIVEAYIDYYRAIRQQEALD